MKISVRSLPVTVAIFAALLVVSAGGVFALQVKQDKGRFGPLVIEDPTTTLDVATTSVSTLPAGDRLRVAWDQFKTAHGSGWSIYLDRRSGAPLLVEGEGIPGLLPPGDVSLKSLEASLRPFIAADRSMLLADDAELVLDRDASARLAPELWQVVFAREVAGVPVEGERYVFTFGYGNLISFGASRWSRVDASPFPDLNAAEAQDRLSAYMGLTASDKVSFTGKPKLEFIALRAEGPNAGATAGPFAGAVGAGYGSTLVWRISATVEGEPGTWLALIDAHTGAVRSFIDDNRYAQAKGGVYPISDDHICPDGCEQANYPMPYADITIGGTPQFANALGIFSCTPGGSLATTNLSGPYIHVSDNCGVVAESVSCDSDLDLRSSGGIDCTVPAGSSVGNTHAARSSYYHLNRIAEHARTWLPSRTWLTQQVSDNINLNQTCNAYWSGVSVNFFKSGGGCNNTGEIAGVFLHEWGHGLDQNDGGGFDNPSEAYADITAFMSTHVSCVGRGFYQSHNCSGYGDSCLNCTGIREQDWAQHASQTPATPQGFVQNFCPGGGGPCGREVHCEAHVSAETMWDLAARDLVAAGLDEASAWQLADKLWYKSRLGSGGNAYNCSLPTSDGCSAGSWFSRLRVVDDDDGNLANGTPHAAAIYAAFARHNIACGAVGAASNQNHTSCPSIGTPTLSSIPGSASAQLSWTAAPGATAYYVLRSDASCSAAGTIVATIPGTTFTDTGLANGFTEYYRVQGIGSNAACDGGLSNCRTVIPQPFAGTIKLDAGLYNCSAVLNVSVTDGNLGAPTTTVKLVSNSEPLGETITLTELSPGSANYAGSLPVTTSAAVTGDGRLSLSNGDAITAIYVDANDGLGGVNIQRQTAAAADCAPPVISKIEASNVSFNAARITWKTDEPATSVLHYGSTVPPGSTSTLTSRVQDHVVDVSGLAECTTYSYSVESADSVGNNATDSSAGAYYTFATGRSSAVDFVSLDTPLAIPDGSPVGATSTINVTQSKTIQDVNVSVNITHPYDGDISLFLTSPSGIEIPLAIQRGGSGDNYTDTTFDDEATGSIANGNAPFTAIYRPESPLSVLDGLASGGAWKLKVEDDFVNDVGTLNSWKLTLTYPPNPCGARGAFQSAAVVADTCGAGGPGSANGVWDAGEQVQFKVSVANTGTVKLTGVSATITSSTPGVVMLDGNASYPGISIGSAADSVAPHFTALLPTNLACGSTIQFQMTITSAQGSWVENFTQTLGSTLGGTGTVMNEGFNAGIPGTWSVVDGGTGGGVASTWTTNNPGLRTFTPPLLAPVAIVDSDSAGTGATQDEQLITPAINLATNARATLQFDQFFRWYAGNANEIADVDVRSSATGGTWVNVLRQQGASSGNPDHPSIDITAQASFAPDVQVRFHNYGGSSEWWWQVDNVRIDTAAFYGCDMTVCGAAQTNFAKPVADGLFGTAMKGSRGNPAGTSIALTWDVSTCASADHHVLYGDLANVATAAVMGAACDLGASGSATWNAVPAGNLWFVVVGDNNVATEGSWGTDGGGQRGGATASGLCGATTRNNAASCP